MPHNNVYTNNGMLILLAIIIIVRHMKLSLCFCFSFQQVQVEVLGEFESTVMPVLDYTYLPVTREGQMCDVYSPTCLAFQGVVDKASR